MIIEKLGQYLTDDEVIYTHLHGDNTVVVEDKIIRLNSTLNIAYTNYKASNNNFYTKDIMPIIGIFAMLDQIGLCYDVDNMSCNDKQGVKRALKLFGNCDEETINTLYALRNSLLHNISFSAEDSTKGNVKKYYFIVNNNAEYLYKKSTIEWNGDYSLLKQDNVVDYVTFISLEKLRYLFEKCLREAQKYAHEKKLKIRLPNGKEQLCINYFLIQNIS